MKKNTSFFHQNYCPLFREESAVVEEGKEVREFQRRKIK